MAGLCYVSSRFGIALLCFAALMVAYIQRFSIAIVMMVMVDPCNEDSSVGFQCPFAPDSGGCSPKQKNWEFKWSERTQGMLMSSFFWGYCLTHLVGGMAADRWGGKYPLWGGMLISAICTLLTPVVTRKGGAWGHITLRVIMGLGQGAVYPSISSIMAKWIPTKERTLTVCFVFTGALCGNIVSMVVSGAVLRLTDESWPHVFYLFGCLSLAYLALWAWAGSSHPLAHPRLSPGESSRLEEYSRSVNISLDVDMYPWKAMSRSRPLWGLVVAEVGHSWGLYTVILELPTYMDQVLHYPIWRTGVWTALPYLAMTIVCLLTGTLVTSLTNKKIASMTTLRKIIASIAAVGPAVGMLAATYSNCDHGLVNLFFIIGMGCMGAYYSSLKINCLDLSPNYAGTLMGTVNGFGSLSGIVSPIVTSYLIVDNTIEEWRTVFMIAAGIMVCSNFIYVLMASGELQPWNTPEVQQRDSRQFISVEESTVDMR